MKCVLLALLLAAAPPWSVARAHCAHQHRHHCPHCDHRPHCRCEDCKPTRTDKREKGDQALREPASKNAQGGSQSQNR